MRLLPRKHVLQRDWLVHLFSAIALIIPLVVVFDHPGLSAWQLVLIMPLFYLQWYVGFWQSGVAIILGFVFMTVLSTWAMSLHWIGVGLCFYGLVFLMSFQRIWSLSIALILQAGWIAFWAWQWQFPVVFILTVTGLLLFGGHADYLFFRMVNAQRDLLVTQEELEYVSRARERERIARDLHDVLGHTLSTIALKSELSEKYLAVQQVNKAQAELADIAQIARQALAEVRTTVTGYRAGNLSSELAMAGHALSAAGIQADLPIAAPRPISRELENLLSLVLREAVTNVVRHANANSCRVQLFNRNRLWHLRVTDDGVGWSGQLGNGLQGMKERLSLFNGRLSLRSLMPGTELTAVVEQLLEGDGHGEH